MFQFSAKLHFDWTGIDLENMLFLTSLAWNGQVMEIFSFWVMVWVLDSDQFTLATRVDWLDFLHSLQFQLSLYAESHSAAKKKKEKKNLFLWKAP